LSVICCAVAMIFFLSVLGMAGVIGIYLDKILRVWIGAGVWFVPPSLLCLSYVLLLREKYTPNKATYIGFVLFIFSIGGFLNFLLNPQNSTKIVDISQAGGFMGAIFEYPLRKYLGPVASILVSISTIIISILLVFNTTLDKMMTHPIVSRGLCAIFLSVKYISNKFRHLVILCTRFISTNIANAVRCYKVRSNANETEDMDVVGDGEMDVDENTAEYVEGHVGAEPQFRVKSIITEEESYTIETIQKPIAIKYKKGIQFPVDLLNLLAAPAHVIDIEHGKDIIKQTLENFRISVAMEEVHIGPTITQYTLKPARGTKLSQITTLSGELSLALSVHPIRIEAPIPGTSLVGIEVPNKISAFVNLRNLLTSQEFKRRKSSMAIVLGKNTTGQTVMADLGSMPHLLIAGATGAGKTVCLHSIIVTLLYQNTPAELKFILIDPKRVEMSAYNSIPHLLAPVITNTKEAVNALRWVAKEMDRRFDLLAVAGMTNLASYNEARKNDQVPYLVVVIDELADLMIKTAREVEPIIIRLTQMARAVGIHLVVATQRPSVNVITGLVKANITSRVAFYVASQVDSKTILDTSGAEKLLGKGDLLYISAELSKPKRLQGAYISSEEIRKVCDYLRSIDVPSYAPDLLCVTTTSLILDDRSGGEVEKGEDELLNTARETILKVGKGSASLLQRRLRIGYARAARLLDLLEDQGIIGPQDGARPREVLVGKEDKENENTN